MIWRALLAALLLAVISPHGAALQGVGPAAAAQIAEGAPDYASWEALARRSEAALQAPRTTSLSLEQLRARIADARARFLEAQNANAARIRTVRGQLDALGPPPEDGASEPDEIAQRRAELRDQLEQLRAPGIRAEEAFRRADGLIREIDSELTRRQTDALLQLWPSPVNPVNWAEGGRAAADVAAALAAELRRARASEQRRAELNDALPLIGVYLLFALIVMARGSLWVERATLAMQEGTKSMRGRQAWALLISTGQVVLPLLGVLALMQAIRASGTMGLTGDALVSVLPHAGFAYLTARWLGARIFPRSERAFSPLTLTERCRREGRVLAILCGVVLALGIISDAAFVRTDLSEAARAVLAFPPVLLGGLLLFRIGQLIRMHSAPDPEEPRYFDRLVGIGGHAAMVLGGGAPLLAAVGYVPAAEAVVFPALISLGLIGILLVLQDLLDSLYALLAGRADDTAGQDLVPVLAGLVLALAALPVLAMIWGMRGSEVLELWTRFREGITLGDTRVSPGDLLTVLIVFLVGFLLTRLLQGTLRSSVLPKTRIDKGGQNALVAGVGYIGIFLAVMIAVTSAGIDLSTLALVAGALSVGIGFGLQNIVSNFVSGIILLIERPVSEGDWIEVGGTMGTVRSISVRSTIIETFDRTDVIVPNADLISGAVTNWTRLNLTGRLIVKVGVAYGSDTREVERILREVAEDQPLAVLNPAPAVLFRGFGESALNFEVRVILRDINFVLNVESDMYHEIARRFAQEGIEVPFAQRDVWLREAGGGPHPVGARQGPAGGGASSPGQAVRPTQQDMAELTDPDMPNEPSSPEADR